MRRTGSSLLVVGEGDGGGGLWVAPVAERAVRALWVVECLGGDGAGIGVFWEAEEGRSNGDTG